MMDKEKVKEMLAQGKSQAEIAREFGKTQQAVYECIKDMRRKGMLPPKEEKPKVEPTTDIVAIAEQYLMLVERAKQAEEFENRINRLQNQLAATRNELVVCQDKLKKYEKLEIRLAVAQGRQVEHGD